MITKQRVAYRFDPRRQVQLDPRGTGDGGREHMLSGRWGSSPVPEWNPKRCRGLGIVIAVEADSQVLYNIKQDLLVQRKIRAMPDWKQGRGVCAVAGVLSICKLHVVPCSERSSMDACDLEVAGYVGLRLVVIEFLQPEQIQIPLREILLQFANLQSRRWRSCGITTLLHPSDGK